MEMEKVKCIRNKKECPLMREDGTCVVRGCLEVAPECNGCQNIEQEGDRKFCSIYWNPPSKWRLGNCPKATHVRDKVLSEIKEKTKINPLKASKRRTKF